ncbi:MULTISPECIES: molybdopterin molybdotransferase MoeA [unclassified Sphingomonas]|jgi:molybdopterin molybdotransferase|uniref:molybdopterin molybdotransferase MoeA n=1 Tax=unclassified Sphingomonas TaxID=196159 RepID=UPI00082DA7E3|nr:MULTISPECIES: molybdopterin molybdotransferase MoeA [unclassified Sphingomonas]
MNAAPPNPAPLAVAEAQRRLLALAGPTPVEHAALHAAAGRWAAAPVQAARTQPASDLAMMDGYALRFADLGAPLRIVGESAAGAPFTGQVRIGQAVRIFTGAPVPAGADTVLVQEEALRERDRLKLSGEGPAAIGANIRPRGLDFVAGAPLIAAGAPLTPPCIALAAIAGHATLPVHRRLRVAIAATGNELVRPGDPIGPAQLPESNGVMLAAMLANLPVDLVDLGILPDDLDTLTAAFGTVDADLLVTSGGASVGDHDLVRPALAAAGVTLDFWRIAMRPGKPLMAGTRGAMVAIGLPGNPVSAFVTATLFVLPLIRARLGARDPFPAMTTAMLGVALPPNGPRADYRRAMRVNGIVVEPARQDSSMLHALADADCLIVRAPHAPAAAPGDSVEILPLAPAGA